MMRRHLATLHAALLLLVFTAASLAHGETKRPVLVLNDTNEPPYTTAQHNGYINEITSEAFRRAGLALRLVKQPPERGLRSANEGSIDGDLTRIAGLDAQFPNLVRVPEKLMDWEFSAFVKSVGPAVNVGTLRSRRLGHIRGWKIYEKQFADASSVVATIDAPQLFNLLGKGRIDAALYERWLGLALLREQGRSDIKPLEPPLAIREMFIYLHRRHADRVPLLAKALADMKAEGFYRRAYAQHLAPYLTAGKK